MKGNSAKAQNKVGPVPLRQKGKGKRIGPPKSKSKAKASAAPKRPVTGRVRVTSQLGTVKTLPVVATVIGRMKSASTNDETQTVNVQVDLPKDLNVTSVHLTFNHSLLDQVRPSGAHFEPDPPTLCLRCMGQGCNYCDHAGVDPNGRSNRTVIQVP